jgi:hypothetical protein
MNLRKCRLSALLVAATALPIWGQTVTPGPLSGSGLMVRLERVYDGENACVLLNRSGDYRLERHFSKKTEVYVGSLPAGAVQQIREILDGPQLSQLSQTDIHRYMNSETFDEFSLDIFRGDTTQRLVFLDPESRKPFRDSLNRLVEWLNKLKKEPHTEIAVSDANRCSPGQGMVKPPTWTAPEGSYMVFLDRDHGSSVGIQRSCVVIYQDGKFRAESTAGIPLGHLSTKAAEGQLDAAQLSELRTLLDDHGLVAMRGHPFNRLGGVYQDIDVIRLAIPRSSSVQMLTLHNEIGRPGGHPGELGGGPPEAMHYEDTNRHAIDPLQKWIKQNVQNRKFTSVADDKATECLPTK